MKKITALLLALLVLTMADAALAAEESGTPATLNAWLLPQAIVPDGDISEAHWALPAEISGASVSARVWASWLPGDLYLAFSLQNAETLTLSLGTKEWTFAAEETITGEGISGIALQNTAELTIDLETAGVTVLDYNQTYPLEVTVTGSGEEAAAVFSLVFTGTQAWQQPFTGSTYSKVTVSADQDTLTLGSATGGYHVVQNITAVDHSKDISLKQRIHVVSMPKSAGTIPTASATGTGYYFTVSDYEGGTACPLLFANLFNDGSELVLRFRCGESGATTYKDIFLGKTVSSDFLLEVIWTAQDNALVYVDGFLVGAAADVTYENTSLGKNALSCRYAGGAAEIHVSQRVLAVVEKYSVLDNLQFSDICGSNPDARHITSALMLPDTVTDELLGTRDLVWSSNAPQVIGTDGTVREVREDTQVTLTVSLKELPVSAKSFTLTVPRLTLEALLAESAITLDGALQELYWPASREFSVTDGTVSGNLRAVWLRGQLWLGLEYQNADTVTLVLGDKEWSLELGETIASEGVSGVASQGIAELSVDLASAGILLTDYNQAADLQVILTGTGGSAKLSEEPLALIFTGVITAKQPFTGTTFSKATVSSDRETLTLGSATGGYHVVQNITAIDHSKNISLRQRISAVSMPVSDGAIPSAAATGVGYYFTVSDYEGGTDCPVLFGNIFNNGTELILRFRYGSGGATTYRDVPLGKPSGSTFDLEILWTSGDDALVYVDGVFAGRADDVSYHSKSFGKNALSSRYAGTAAEIHISDRILTVPQFTSIGEEMTVSAVLPDTDLLHIAEDLPLPETFVSQYLGELDLEWCSSDEALVSNTGKVQRPEGSLGRYTTLTLKLDGRNIWTEDVFVLPEDPYMPQSSMILDAAFTAETVTVDGSLEEEGWNLNTDLWAGDQSCGAFGVQWDLDNLYIGVQTNGNVLSITLDGKQLDLSEGKTVSDALEIAVPLKDLGITVTDYGTELRAAVTAGSGAWQGIIRLTSTDWYITDSTAPRTSATGATVSMAGGAVAADYQGAQQTQQGWHFYDLYAPDGSAGDYVRTYRIFNVSQLADRSKAVWTEMNLLVEAMPVYDPTSSVNWSGSYASYGLCWHLSDQRVDGYTNTVIMGIFNTENGLIFAVKGQGNTLTVPLNRYVGQRFRLSTCWETDGSLTLWLDGEQVRNFAHVTNTMAGMGSNNLIINLIRNRNAAESKNDDISVWVEDLSLGYHYGRQLLDTLTFETIAGSNSNPNHITENLILPETLGSSQIPNGGALTWVSSDTAVISNTGAVTVPRYSTVVELTAATADGRTKIFTLCVKGTQQDESVLLIRQDWNPAAGVGTVEDVYPFYLDTDNNSLIRDLGITDTVSVVRLADSDAQNRLNESVLTLWVSDDNVTYTQVKDFKLLHAGQYVYLYDFTAVGRYIKVHCTHYDQTEADFYGLPSEMIQAYYEEIFGGAAGSFLEDTVTVTNPGSVIAYDRVWSLDGEYQRVLLDGRLLYHYTEAGKTYVRIPKIAPGKAVTLTVLSGNPEAMDISNKEYTKEVVYGTREARVITGSGRWITTLPDGSLMSIDGVDVKDGSTVLYRYLTWSRSYDGGMTWTDPVQIVCQEGDYDVSGGGVTYDPNTGRLLVVSFRSDPPSCKLFFLYSDDLGATWHLCPEVTVTGTPAEYALTYTPPTVLSTHDGAGENIDLVVPVAAIFNEEGSFCVRVVYSADGGLTWTMGEDQINYTGQGLYHNESGTSEGTILERTDGTLVLYARCQYDSVNYFACATSADHGISWTEAELSTVYTVNTQPMAYRFGELPILVWGGNNAMGGNSYMRFPMSIGVFTPDLMGVEQIQDLYSRYSLQGMNRETMNKITNPSVAHSGDSLTVSWWANSGRLIMRADALTDYLFLTKGAWDSFETASVKAEGWSATWGSTQLSDEKASHGNYAMLLGEGSGAARSVPWMQKGSVSLDLYVGENPGNMTIELESAYSDTFGKAAPIAIRVENGCIGDFALKTDAWNHLEFTLDLASQIPMSTLSVNGQTMDLSVNTAAGNYICYVDISTETACWLDAFSVEDDDPEHTREADLPGFRGNLTLNETIDLNVIVPEGVETEGNVISVKFTDGTDAPYTVLDTAYGKVIRHSLFANQMAREITVQIFDSNGIPLTKELTISIRGYAEKYLPYAGTDVEKALLIRMLDYGALAQLYLDPNADNLANSIIGEDLREWVNAYDMGTPDPYSPASGSNGGVFSGNLSLSESIVMNILTDASHIGPNEKLVVKLDGQVLAESKYRLTVLEDGRLCVSYGFHADRMNEELTVAIADTDTGVSRVALSMSIRKYAHMCMDAYKESNPTLCTMLVAMLDYGALAQQYAKTDLSDLANRYVTAQQRDALLLYLWPES